MTDISNHCKRMEARIRNAGTPLWEIYGLVLLFVVAPLTVGGLLAVILL